MGRIDLGAGGVPASPLVNHELDVVGGVKQSEDRPLIADQRLHLVGLEELLVPLIGRELQGVAGRPTVVVRSPALDRRPAAIGPLGEETPGPVEVVAVRPGGDEVELYTVLGKPLGELAI